MALTMGARPLVVQDAQDTAFMAESYVSSLTPMTTVGESSLAGAEKMIFLAPAAMWGATLSAVRKAPVDSQMYSAPMAPKGISDGSRVCVVGVRTPSIMRPSAVDGVVLELVGHVLVGGARVDELEVDGVRLGHDAGHEAADAAEAVDAAGRRLGGGLGARGRR